MKYKKLILYAAVVATVAAWIVVGVGLAIDVEQTTLLFMFGGAAIATEVLFWAVAIVFGISMFESRKKIWHWIKSKLSFGKAD